MKLNDFINKMAGTFATIKAWHEADGVDEDMFLYFQEDTGELKFVFLGLIGPIYAGAFTKALGLPFVKDVGFHSTIDTEGYIIPGAHDIVVILNEGIEDLEMDEGKCDCEECQCEECEEEDPDEKMWN